MRKIQFIIVHCSATKEGKDFKAKDIDKWHKEKGWDRIGYHYVVDLDGTIEPGRPEEQVGAHAKGYNNNSIGVCYIGGLDTNGKSKDTRTPQQKESLIKLLKELKAKYPLVQILGHRDLLGVYKDCPCFNARIEYADI